MFIGVVVAQREKLFESTKPFHCCYFMGLQRNQGVPAKEAEQFDIRLTVEEFKHNVGTYTLWKPGMDIHVTHVRHRNIPLFVFPGGVRPPRPTRVPGESRCCSEPKAATCALTDNSCDGKAVDEVEGARKRKPDVNDMNSNSKKSKCLSTGTSSVKVYQSSSPPIGSGPSAVTSDSMNSTALEGGQKELAVESIGGGLNKMKNDAELPSMIGSSSSREAEKHAIEKIMSGPYDPHQEMPEELDELEDDFDFGNQVKDLGECTKNSGVESSAGKAVVAVPIIAHNRAGACSSTYPGGSLEELEPAELAAPLTNGVHSAPVSQRKPLIKLSFTSLAKATSKST